MLHGYQVRFANSEDWSWNGRLSSEILVIADDMTSALMKALEHFADLKEKLQASEVPETAIDSLRIRSISEQYESVNGDIATNTEKSAAQWAEEVAQRLKRNAG